MDDNLIGKQLGAFQVVAQLGEGGLATVYKAYQPRVERYVALKVFPRFYTADPSFLAQFRQVARAIAGLEHPGIVPLYDFGEAEGHVFLALRLLDSGTLADVLTRGPLTLAEVRGVISEVGEALNYAHAQGVVHGDVKPSNVLLDERGHSLLADFGSAQMVAGSVRLSGSQAMLGTPAYLSPEQCQGKPPDARSDIYALGLVLYELVTGRVPFSAETPMAVMVQQIRAPVPPPHTLNPKVPEAVEEVILKALAKRPEQRYQTAGELVHALQGAIYDGDTVALTPAPAEAAQPDAGAAGEAAPKLTPAERAARRRETRLLLAVAAGWAVGGGLASAVARAIPEMVSASIAAMAVGWAWGGLATALVLRVARQARRWTQVVWLTLAIGLGGPLVGLALLVALLLAYTILRAAGATGSTWVDASLVAALIFLVPALTGGALGGFISRILKPTKGGLKLAHTLRFCVGWSGAVLLMPVIGLTLGMAHGAHPVCLWVAAPVMFAGAGLVGNVVMLRELAKVPDEAAVTLAQKLKTSRRAVWATISWLASWAAASLAIAAVAALWYYAGSAGPNSGPLIVLLVAIGLLIVVSGPWGVCRGVASFLQALNKDIAAGAGNDITLVLTLSLVLAESILAAAVALAYALFANRLQFIWLLWAGPWQGLIADILASLAALLIAWLVLRGALATMPHWAKTPDQRSRLALTLLAWALANFVPASLMVGAVAGGPTWTTLGLISAPLMLALAQWNTGRQFAALAQEIEAGPAASGGASAGAEAGASSATEAATHEP